MDLRNNLKRVFSIIISIYHVSRPTVTKKMQDIPYKMSQPAMHTESQPPVADVSTFHLCQNTLRGITRRCQTRLHAPPNHADGPGNL